MPTHRYLVVRNHLPICTDIFPSALIFFQLLKQFHAKKRKNHWLWKCFCLDWHYEYHQENSSSFANRSGLEDTKGEEILFCSFISQGKADAVLLKSVKLNLSEIAVSPNVLKWVKVHVQHSLNNHQVQLPGRNPPLPHPRVAPLLDKEIWQEVCRLKGARTGGVEEILFSDLLSLVTDNSVPSRCCTQREHPRVRDTVLSLCAVWAPWQFPDIGKTKKPCALFSSYHPFPWSSFPVVSLLWPVLISECWWGCLLSQHLSRRCCGCFTRATLGE